LNSSPSSQPDLPHPTSPNLTWRTIRITLRIPFCMLFNLRARGFENLPASGALFLVNHQSFLDPLLVGAPLTRPVSYLARDNLFRVPGVGWAIRNTYVMPISREAAGSASIRESIRRIHHGFYVGIFPEGTRSVDGSIGELKPGFLMLARLANAPVIPVGIAGAYRVFPKKAKLVRPGCVRVVYGKPLPPEWFSSKANKSDQGELISRIHDRMQEVLDEANAWRDLHYA
jgi:1-acyl-sn-glycerol-3-phosphate acyltransferase